MSHTSYHECFPELFVRSQRRIYGFILTVVPDAHEADDVFQETSLILWKKADQFDPAGDFVRWACGIAMNVIRNRRVKHARDRHVFSDEMLNQISEARISHSTRLEERIVALTACLKGLSSVQRELLQSFYGARASAADLAAHIGTTENALYQRLHRIRQRLLACVESKMTPEARI